MVDRRAVEQATRDYLRAVGVNPDDPAFVATPIRVADAAAELFRGVGVDASDLFHETIPAPAHDLVVMTGIRVRSTCAHHLLPFYGTASIAYAPDDRLVGLGTLPRLVDVLASRPQMQEALTAEIADALLSGVGALGVFIRLSVHQDCVSARGARQDAARTVTVAARGALAVEPARSAAAHAIAEASAGAYAGDAHEVAHEVHAYDAAIDVNEKERRSA